MISASRVCRRSVRARYPISRHIIPCVSIDTLIVAIHLPFSRGLRTMPARINMLRRRPQSLLPMFPLALPVFPTTVLHIRI